MRIMDQSKFSFLFYQWQIQDELHENEEILAQGGRIPGAPYYDNVSR